MEAIKPADLAKEPTSLVSLSQNKPPEAKTSTKKQCIITDRAKHIANGVVNGGAATFGLLTFLNGNFHVFEGLQEYLEPVSEKLERLGNALSGVIGGIDLYQKKNIAPLIGYTSMVPISLFFDAYNNWLMRGFSIGLNSFAFIIDRRKVIDKEGNVKKFTGDFSDKGWMEGIKTTLGESGKLLKEVIKTPARVTEFSHAILLTSLTQLVSPFIAFFGNRTLGSTIRNISGVAGYVGLLMDERIPGGKFGGINLKSSVVQCSILRIGTAIFDFMKHFDFFSDRISNLTDVSLALDRLAGMKFTKGIFDIKKVKAN